jgi:hypothetical protein
VNTLVKEIMSNVVSTQTAAQTIGDQASDPAMRARRAGAAQAALMSQCMATVMAAGEQAQRLRNGRELTIFERDFDRVATLADAIAEGNYRDTAASLAGIAESGVRAWLKAADDGDERYQPIAMLIRAAEAIAESDSVRDVRTAGKDPRFWASAMTYLERKHPEKWRRRTDSDSGPKVIVQIGVRDSDVQVRIQSQPEPPAINGTATDADDS